MTRLKLTDVNEFTNNPRVITKAQYDLLQETMDELDAAEYRYNTRKLSEKGRFDRVLGMSEGRLTYKQLTKKVS